MYIYIKYKDVMEYFAIKMHLKILFASLKNNFVSHYIRAKYNYSAC